MVADTLERKERTDRLFFALSDATRRDIVTKTLDRERSVSDLGRLYPISLTAVQKHVEVLVDAGLISKHRNGREQLVRGEVMRGKFRNSFERPEPFSPGVPTEVPFTIQDVYHTFRPGHRVMVQVQGSWFPLVDRNPQKFVDIYAARSSDFGKETHRVYRSPGRSSRLKILVKP